MAEIELLQFESKSQNINIATGSLIALENNRNIPFAIKRVYYIYNVEKETVRGFHAHKTLQQVLLCLHGSIEICCDNGITKERFLLNDPTLGLFIGKNTWRTMKWIVSKSVLVVLASDFFDENDYIRDYNDFIEYLKIIKEKNESTF